MVFYMGEVNSFEQLAFYFLSIIFRKKTAHFVKILGNFLFDK